MAPDSEQLLNTLIWAVVVIVGIVAFASLVRTALRYRYRRGKRLAIGERLIIAGDAELVLVRCDDREYLICIGPTSGFLVDAHMRRTARAAWAHGLAPGPAEAQATGPPPPVPPATSQPATAAPPPPPAQPAPSPPAEPRMPPAAPASPPPPGAAVRPAAPPHPRRATTAPSPKSGASDTANEGGKGA